MENKFLKIEDREEWKNLLDKVLFKTFFHSLEWEEFLEKEFKWLKFERYLWQSQAILSLARIKVGGKEKLISHPFCEYGGPLPLIEKIDGHGFQEDLFDQFKTPLKISFHPYLLDYFENLGKQESQRETYLFEEVDAPNLAQAIGDRNRQRLIKIAEEEKIEAKKCEKLEDLKALYNLYVKNLKKHKVPVYPFSFFEFFFEESKKENPNAEILLFWRENKNKRELAGGNVFLSYGKIVHSFLCGFDEKSRKSEAHSIVIWTEIKSAQRRGQKVFDFGATQKISSNKDFKQRWGGKAFPVFELKNYSGGSKIRDSFFRDVWGCLPAGLIKLLSPHFIKYKL